MPHQSDGFTWFPEFRIDAETKDAAMVVLFDEYDDAYNDGDAFWIPRSVCDNMPGFKTLDYIPFHMERDLGVKTWWVEKQDWWEDEN